MADMQSNGAPGSGSANGNDAEILSQIHQALQVVHQPYSTNQARRDAESFLENIKTADTAPTHGHILAADKSNPPVVRHYGLSVLETAVKRRWAEYNPDQAATLRGWVIELCRALSEDDPQYIRNKTAQLWVEIASRSWVAEWMNMDELLVQLWQIPDSGVHKELVMTILESLGSDICFADDITVTMRQADLYKGWTEITNPLSVLKEVKNRNNPPAVRHGDDGWVVRMVELLEQCLNGDMQNRVVRSCAIKSLSVLSTIMPCLLPKGVAAARVVPVVYRALSAPEVSLQKAALDVLHSLYARDDFFSTGEFVDLVGPMYAASSVEMLRMLFQWSAVDVEDIDDDKYQFSKKFTEVLSSLGNYLDRKYSIVPPESDVDGFLKLLFLAAQSQSLIVSIPIMVSWSRLLQNSAIEQRAANSQLIGPLLELCESRLIRYEHLPEANRNATYQFLMEDTDTMPERHALLGNYRRYCMQIIEAIIFSRPTEAIPHILGQTDHVLQHVYDGQPGFSAIDYTKNSTPVLRVDAHLTVIDAMNKGFLRYRTFYLRQHDPEPEVVQRVSALEDGLESWCNKLLDLKFEDPMIRKRILHLLVAFSTTALDRRPGFMLKVLEHMLMTWPSPQPEHRALNDAIKDLQSESMFELQRLASKVPDHLLAVYEQLERRVKDMMDSGTLDEKRQLAYQTFLFIIVHRASSIDPGTRLHRLGEFIHPVLEQWRNPGLKSALSTFPGFCELMALDRAKQYLLKHQAHTISDWGACKLDEEGLSLQAELEERQKVLPIRPTKSFLSYSVEKIEKGSPSFQTSYSLWGDHFPIILPDILQFLSHAHAVHNPDSWPEFQQDKQSTIKRVLSDRFWQAGISEGSKDDFYARVTNKKGTLEGLASTMRSSVRFVRETSYAILYCMSRLESYFYGFAELPNPLAQALYENAVHLSAHQQINLLNLTRYLVDDCPVQQREHFLPPLLASCFQQMDAKINSEWENLEHQQSVDAAGEALTEEMKAESILRQVTHTAVIMVADLLDPAKKNPQPKQGSPPVRYPSLRKFCLETSSIVEPLLLFCTHAIRMRDTRCCSVVLRVFKSIVPDFHVPDTPPQAAAEVSAAASDVDAYLDTSPIPPEKAAPIREYISSEVLRACITSFHEPYFVDLQKELAALIAAILVYYGPLTNTPREVLLSLPNIRVDDVNRLGEFSAKPGSQTRQQRAMVLHILKDLKGVSISEMGKLPRSNAPKKPTRSKMAQEFMTPGEGGAAKQQATTGIEDGQLEGVMNLFNTD